MASNQVVIKGESGSLNLFVVPFGASPTMEFRSGSYKGSVDERRVLYVFVTIPSLAKDATLRMEFTDPSYAEMDLVGTPTRLSEVKEVEPYKEPRQTRQITEGR